jgi:hypothetical protein
VIAAPVACVPLSGVEHHEVVRDAVVADRGHVVPGCAQPGSVGLALVAEHVGFVDDQERRR